MTSSYLLPDLLLARGQLPAEVIACTGGFLQPLRGALHLPAEGCCLLLKLPAQKHTSATQLQRSGYPSRLTPLFRKELRGCIAAVCVRRRTACVYEVHRWPFLAVQRRQEGGKG